MPRYTALSLYFSRKHGRRIQKIPLDVPHGGEMGCPNLKVRVQKNQKKTNSCGEEEFSPATRGGCIFCNAHGSGTGLAAQGLNIGEQWALWMERYAKSRKASTGYLAYLQSYSNTYGTAADLAALLDSLPGLPGIEGVSIGTRPDCLDDEKIATLAAFPKAERWIELGVQTSHDKTLERINRGHDAACSALAATVCADAGLQVCAHLIFGLPGESRADMLDTVRWLNTLPVHGVKIHNLFIAEGTELARMWRHKLYTPIDESAYLELVLESIATLRQDITIHRLVSDTMNEQLLAPPWAAMHFRMMQRINSMLVQRDLWQGKNLGQPMPDDFS